jgi:hypothetical protein
MTDDTITMPRKLAEDLYGILADVVRTQHYSPPEIGWSIGDALVGRQLATVLDADPALMVAPGQEGNFPHVFKPGEWTDFRRYGNSPGQGFETEQDVIRRLGRFPYETCAVQGHVEPCSKPKGDPIHTAEMGA